MFLLCFFIRSIEGFAFTICFKLWFIVLSRHVYIVFYETLNASFPRILELIIRGRLLI